MIKFCAPTATATAFWPHTTELKMPTLFSSTSTTATQDHCSISRKVAKQQVTKSERR